MNNWIVFLKKNWTAFSLVILLFILFAYLFNFVLLHLQSQKSILFHDPVFDWYSALDISPIIFVLTYGSLLTFMLFNRKSPLHYYWFIKGYAFLLLLRSISVYLLPLECSPQAIPLNDPVLNHLFYPNGYACNDLFFSGHVATVFMMALFSVKPKQRLLFYVLTFLTALAVLIQKVHYSVDVLAAPFFVFVGVYLSRLNWPFIKIDKI